MESDGIIYCKFVFCLWIPRWNSLRISLAIGMIGSHVQYKSPVQVYPFMPDRSPKFKVVLPNLPNRTKTSYLHRISEEINGGVSKTVVVK
jgi:hypothetical protein